MIIYNYGEVILAFTGYIFIYLYLYLSSNIGLIVAINSLLCHLSLAINHYHKLLYRNIDIITKNLDNISIKARKYALENKIIPTLKTYNKINIFWTQSLHLFVMNC